MPSVYDLKPAFQGLLRPLLRGMARVGVTANQVTVAAALLSIGVGGVLALRPNRIKLLLLLPGALLMRMALNAMDGMLAREFGQASKLGAMLNELGDVVSDAALYLPLALWSAFGLWPTVLFVLASVISEMTGVVAIQIGAPRRYDGPMGKSDRAFILGAIGLALGLGLPEGRWVQGLMWVLVALTSFTVINRARRALHEAEVH